MSRLSSPIESIKPHHTVVVVGSGYGGVIAAGVPILTLVGTQFPAVRAFLFAWGKPALSALGTG